MAQSLKKKFGVRMLFLGGASSAILPDQSRAFTRARVLAVIVYLAALTGSVALVLSFWLYLYALELGGPLVVVLFINFVLYNIICSAISYPQRKKIDGEYTGAITRAWERVCGKFQTTAVHVGYMDGPPNAAVAKGLMKRRLWVFCSKQLLLSSRDFEVAGVFAHELGHTKIPFGMHLFSFFDATLFGAFRLFTTFYVEAARELVRWRPKKSATKVVRSILLWLFVLLATLCFPFSGLLVSLAREHAADMFAASLGHAAGFAHWLDRRQPAPKTRIWAYLAWFSTHPPSYVRARALRRVAYKARWEC